MPHTTTSSLRMPLLFTAVAIVAGSACTHTRTVVVRDDDPPPQVVVVERQAPPPPSQVIVVERRGHRHVERHYPSRPTVIHREERRVVHVPAPVVHEVVVDRRARTRAPAQRPDDVSCRGGCNHGHHDHGNGKGRGHDDHGNGKGRGHDDHGNGKGRGHDDGYGRGQERSAAREAQRDDRRADRIAYRGDDNRGKGKGRGRD